MSIQVCIGDYVAIVKMGNSFVVEVDDGYDLFSEGLSKDTLQDLISKIEGFVNCGIKDDALNLVSTNQSIIDSVSSYTNGFALDFENGFGYSVSVYKPTADFIKILNDLKNLVK